jgi:chromosome partitioning protein
MFAREGRTLLLDLDAQGNLTYALGADIAAGAGSWEVLARTVAPKDAVRPLTGSLSFIGSSPSLAAADLYLTATGKEYRLKEALDALAPSFDWCIIDTPPALGILTVNALTAADGMVIPTQADIFSLQGIGQLKETVETVRRYCNPTLAVYGILLARYNPRAIIGREVRETLEGTVAEGLQTRLFRTAIRECTAVKEAQASRTGLFDYAPQCNAALDYEDFFKELTEVLNG